MYAITWKNPAITVTLSLLSVLGCESTTPPVAPGTVEPGPTAAPAKGQIAYDGYQSGVAGIFLTDAATPGSVALASGRSPAWSPDGSMLLFSNTTCETDWETYKRCEKGGVMMMEFPTRVVTPLANGGSGEYPAWSPNGDLIAFVRYVESSGYDLFVMHSDGSGLHEIATPGFNEVFNPSFSPDGQRIAFVCERSVAEICIVNVDGTGLAKLPDNVAGAKWSPSWSPDGKVLAFDAGSKIVLASPDGSEPIVLTDGRHPTWSPDGNQIAFSRAEFGLFTMNRDGTDIRRLTTGAHYSPAWRPAPR